MQVHKNKIAVSDIISLQQYLLVSLLYFTVQSSAAVVKLLKKWNTGKKPKEKADSNRLSFSVSVHFFQTLKIDRRMSLTVCWENT